MVIVACCLLSTPARGGFGAGACIGDCNGDGTVDVAEIIVGVRIALEETPWADCRNHAPAGTFGAVSGLTTAVRLALTGCFAERDYSAFDRFEYGTSSGLGFCPSPGLFSAVVEPVADGHRLVRAHLVAGQLGLDPCLPGTIDVSEDGALACPTLRADADRLLSDAEMGALRAGFAAVPITNSPDPFCVRGFVDPCVSTLLRWDESAATTFSCSWPRPRGATGFEIAALLTSLPGEMAPVAACGDGSLDAGEACDPALHGRSACAPNCTPASARACHLEPTRSRLTLDAATGMPVDVALGGTQQLAVGAARGESVIGDATLFRAHDVPIAIPSPGLAIAPVAAGDRCVCVVAAPEHPETDAAAVGLVDCDESHVAGTGLIGYRLAIGVLRDGGRCAAAPRGADGSCGIADYGSDCAPCTADDAVRTVVGVGLTTSTVYFEEPPYEESGVPFDCEDLRQGTGALGGPELVARFPIAGGTGVLSLSCQ